jgi:hypothetical protein
LLEQRQSQRPRRFSEGRISYGGRYRLRCLVVNISKLGARLALKSVTTSLPAEFLLSISEKGRETSYWARTKWRQGNTLGVDFTEPPAVGEPLLGVSRGRGSYRA